MEICADGKKMTTASKHSVRRWVDMKNTSTQEDIKEKNKQSRS